MMDIYIYVSIYLYYINIYGSAGPLLVQGLRGNLHGLLGAAHGVGAVIPRGAARRGPWGFSMGKMVVLVGFPPLNHEKCGFFSEEKSWEEWKDQ